MPLEGLTEDTKVKLLRKLVNKQLSVKELQESAVSIKIKKGVADAFMTYTGCENWEDLQRRFPKHATGEKLSQFKNLKIAPKGKLKDLPVVSD